MLSAFNLIVKMLPRALQEWLRFVQNSIGIIVYLYVRLRIICTKPNSMSVTVFCLMKKVYNLILKRDK